MNKESYVEQETLSTKPQTARLLQQVSVKLPLWGWLLVLVALAGVVAVGAGYFRRQGEAAQEAIAGIWTDPETKLTWTKADNGSTIDWAAATDYCESLHTGGYSGWRVPERGELLTIWERGRKRGQLKGGIRLSTDRGPRLWTSTVDMYAPNADPKPFLAIAIFFAFGHGGWGNADLNSKDVARTLCVSGYYGGHVFVRDSWTLPDTAKP